MTDQSSPPEPIKANPDVSGVAVLHQDSGNGPRVIVKHNVVGRYLQHSIVPVEHFGDQLERLLGLGAVSHYDGSGTPDQPQMPTLSEALRSESPPTLPVYSGIDTTPEEVAHVVDQSDTFAGGPLSEDVRLQPGAQVEQPKTTKAQKG